jgi:hypothetical protein
MTNLRTHCLRLLTPNGMCYSLTGMLRFYLVPVLFALAASTQLPTSAQQVSCLHRTLALNVDDSQGLPVRGLSPADFQAKLRVGPPKILSIVPDDRIHRIVILIDASGSMNRVWRESLAPASALAETSLPHVQMALLVFGTNVYEKIEFSKGQNAVAEKLRQIRSSEAYSHQLFHGKTALYDSLLAGLQLLDSPSSADSLYVITDGQENASRSHFDDVAHRFISTGVRLFVSQVVADDTLNPHSGSGELDGPARFHELARKTGGEMIRPFRDGVVPTKPREAQRIAEGVNAFHKNMIHNFRLEVELPPPMDQWHSWELKLAGPKDRWKNVRLLYPTQLAPCGP